MPAMTQDCAAVLSNGRRVLESVLALTAGTSAVWLGARWHAAPRRAVRTAVEHYPGKFCDMCSFAWLAKLLNIRLNFDLIQIVTLSFLPKEL